MTQDWPGNVHQRAELSIACSHLDSEVGKRGSFLLSTGPLSPENLEEDLGHHGLTLPFVQPQDLFFSRDRIGVPKCPEVRVHEGSGQAPQCQVDGSMGEALPTDTICHDSLVSSALLGWLRDPHITPSALGLGILPLSLPPLPSPCPIERETRGVEQRF